EVFHRPANPFVATFMGADNALELVAQAPANDGQFTVAGDSAVLDLSAHPHGGSVNGSRVRAFFRSEAATLSRPSNETPVNDVIRLPGAIEQIAYLGEHWRCRVKMGGASVWVDTDKPMAVGTSAVVKVPVAALHLFPVAT